MLGRGVISAIKNNQSFGLAAGMLEIMTANRLCPRHSKGHCSSNESRFATGTLAGFTIPI